MLQKLITKSSPERSNSDRRIRTLKKRLYQHGALVAAAIALTVILVFSMTAAWFTNIISVEDLTFQADSWGIDGEVVVSADMIEAAPGDTGMISLMVTNKGEVPATITVNISKAYMNPADMQKRIYFYADQPAVINGETVQKQYLSNGGGFSYRLYGGESLILNEQIHTDVVLKWEWVYDVVGYYFRGTVVDGQIQVEEYLRPVEYDFENAQYDEDGDVTMVDSKTTIASFLAALTEADGYAGAYSVKTDENGDEILVDETGETVVLYNKCYPIDDDNGIWLYMCSRKDIIENTNWDTQYGAQQLDASDNFQARITVTAQQYQPQTRPIETVDALQAAINNNDGSVIQLAQDLVLDQPLALEAGAQAILDLNGHQITSDQNSVFSVASAAQLTVCNGSIVGNGEDTVAVQSVGGQVTLNNVEITDVYQAINISDHKTENESGDNSVIRITNCSLKSSSVTVMISGDGTLSDGNTALLIQNSTIISTEYFGISGNGTSTGTGRWGTDIQVIDSIVSGYWSGIYHPQMNSTLTISGSTVSGFTGMAIKGGDVTVLDSVIEGTGEGADVVDPEGKTPSSSGYMDTGDGIYIESDYGYAITLSISGECQISHKADTAKAVRVYPDANYVRVQVTGGSFDSDVSAFLPEGYTQTEVDGQYQVAMTQENE